MPSEIPGNGPFVNRDLWLHRSLYHLRLANARTPNATSIAPDRRLIHRNTRGLTLARTAATPLLRSTHHRADPTRTPRTSRMVAGDALPVVPTPKLAKIAAKER